MFRGRLGSLKHERVYQVGLAHSYYDSVEARDLLCETLKHQHVKPSVSTLNFESLLKAR
jgi:hypothetical protein